MSEQTAGQRQAFVASLREMADFFEQHPTVPIPTVDTVFNVFAKDREELAAIARAASWQKRYDDTWFMLAKQFGDLIRYEVNIYRDTICRKVVTGTRIEPARPAEPDLEVEVFEWVCDDASLLAVK